MELFLGNKDINECESITGLCEQNCVNTWGSYKCTCGTGYTIGEEGRLLTIFLPFLN